MTGSIGAGMSGWTLHDLATGEEHLQRNHEDDEVLQGRLEKVWEYGHEVLVDDMPAWYCIECEKDLQNRRL
jgi:hypothetical protein